MYVNNLSNDIFHNFINNHYIIPLLYTVILLYISYISNLKLIIDYDEHYVLY